MQFTQTIIAALTLALTATAVPTGGGGGNGNISCNNGQLYCCNSTAVGILPINLTCILSSLLLSPNCGANTICCSNTGSGVSSPPFPRVAIAQTLTSSQSQTCTNSSGLNIAIPILVDIL